MKLNCIAIDDEPLALDVIAYHASKIPFLNLKAKVGNAFEAIDLLHKEKFDLIFLDIQMPELTGFELLRTIQHKPMVIFTTAYPNFALESYELDAVDYLVKPIPFERFLKAVNKVKQRMTQPPEATEVTSTTSSSPDFMFVKTEYKTVKIFLDEVLYIESEKDYVAFQLKNEKILSLLSMKSVEEFLPKENFVRVHRSFIIAFNKIEEIERNNIIICKKIIPVGDNYKDFFKLLIDGKKL
ncbi:MAG: DNA-binding response regulator [Chitinophagaceae bacterium]|nr:DNA-binding response regulator [Chitinophagaceae bacterium]